MRAAVFKGVGEPLEVETVDTPDCGEDEVVVETEACGVCRSDWHAWRGDWEWIGVVPTPGLIFGHEPVGRVREVGANVDRFAEGDRVTNPFHLGDGTCRHCRTGHGNRCERGVPMGFVPFQQGAFAEQYSVRYADHNLVTLPEDVDPVDVAGLGCRFATAFHGLVHRVEVAPGDTVAIHGCGGVGLSAVHVADVLGAKVVAVDIEESKLERARELGAAATVDSTAVDNVSSAVSARAESGHGTGGIDVSVDALGIAETVQNSIDCLGKGGQHLQIGMTTSEEEGSVSVPVDQMVFDEQSFHAAYGAPPTEYDEILRLMEQGRLDPGRIVGETVTLGEVPTVMERLDDFETVGIPVCTEF
ncbi:MAG: zinc-dependent alcohol dehydrogenase family protein [Haloarculaceae archaeon]